ncbi:hypothetical protein O3G_MSEX001770 [Manduca sexta]|uniref:WW domain-containing protein n=1 Tax=Manduca sexta TaxID=7130 RepID=A0A922CCR7_MANSE|nr:hypothetical protein O3G_MSEX001770 [Manduca sexta]KAG6441382.1 hypothetical protein O3G_MSEX001770 [Manduca sexta]
MDEQEKKPQRTTANPQTERWVLLDSKSNPGRKYYYNPLTKQTLWHYTDEEINKKKKKINDGSDQINIAKTATQFDLLKNNQACTNETRVINSMYPITSLPWNLANVQAPMPFIQPTTIPLIQQNLPAALINSQFLGNQIISQPTQAALINLQSGSPTTINQMQNITRFEQNFDINTYQTNKAKIKFNKCATNRRKDYKSDLRNKLEKRNHARHHINKKRYNKEEVQGNESWDEETVKNILLYLKCYISPSKEQNMWYIVPETNVILKHSRLLTLMTGLDCTCHLKIPLLVRMKLKPIEKKPGNEAISRLIRFYCTEKETDIHPENAGDNFSNILNTCHNLMDNNYHVVLLCDNDKSFIEFKKKINTPVFTVDKFIELQNQGRLIPRNRFTSSETITKEPFSNNEQNNKKTSDSIVSDQPGLINIQSVPISCNNGDSSTSSKRRLIKLKACEEIPTTSHSSKRKRWSALRNKCQESSSAILQPVSNNKDADSNILENVQNTLSQTEVDEIDSPKVELPKQKNEHCEVLSTNETITTVVEGASTNNIHHENICSDYEDKYKLPGIKKFLQTMINVLLKVLNQDPIEIEKEISQLQRLREAVLDIIKNFSEHWMIVDAANKLSMTITQYIKGNVEMDQKFRDDMNSYGVNLLKSLEEKCCCPEYIQDTVKLLENSCDDRKSSEDSCHDTLTSVAKDQGQEVTTDNYMKGGSDPNDLSETIKPNVEIVSAEESSSGIEKDNDNNCRLNKSQMKENTNQEDLFKALKLRKIENELTENNDVSDICIDNEETESKNSERNNTRQNNVNENVCNEVFEDKTESMETECKNIKLGEEIGEFVELSDEGESRRFRTNNKSKGQFKYFIGMFVKEVRDALLVCAENFQICTTEQNVNNDFSRKFGQVHTHLRNMQRSLESILQRDTGDINNNFKSLLTRAGVDIEFDQNVCGEYREVVQECKNQVDGFLKLLEEKLFDQSCDDHFPSPQYI